MTAQHFMQNPGDSPVDISGHVLLPGIGEDGFRLQTNAEQGAVAGSEVEFDDPAGTFYPIGLNAYRVYETESEADDPLLFSGGFTTRRQIRGPYRTLGARKVAATIEDGNNGLSRFVVRSDEEGDRPEETETERMTWLFTTSGMALHWDFSTSILDLGPTLMPANDFTDFTLQQVLDDMAQQTGKNYYVFWDGSVGNPPEALLVYGFDSGTHLTSDLRFSNVETDVDDETTFYLGLDTELSIDPSRIASYVVVRYRNGRVDESDSATADEFSRIDRVMDGSYIKTASAATARALKYLQELGSEETIVSGTVYLPASKASQFRAGMRVEMKASHLTGMSDFVWVRLVNVTITQLTTPEQVISYALAFEGTLSPGTSCELIIEGLVAQSEGPHNFGGIDFGPVTGDAIAGSGSDTLTLALFVTYSAEVSLHSVTVGSPWTAGTEKPGDVGGSHTETLVAYMDDAVSTPEWNWTNYTYGWHQVAVVIPTTASAWEQEADINGLGIITWDTPPSPGNLLYLARIGEGPSLFNGPPLGADWTLLYDELINESGIIQIYVACCPDDVSDLESGEAGSSWWAHCYEVAIA